MAEFGICPAAVDRASTGINGGRNAGRYCWAVAGTFCGGQKQGSYAQKRLNCMTCEVFNMIKQEEGSRFVLLTPADRRRLGG